MITTEAPPRPSRLRRRLAGVTLAALGALALFVVAGLPLYVLPVVDEPRPVDAVLVLGPTNEAKLQTAQRLLEEGLADTLVLSTPVGEFAEFCAAEHDFEVLCFRPSPSTTQGEARELGSLAEARGWDSAMVIAMTPHITRARMIVERCFDGELAMISDGAALSLTEWIGQYIYQTGAFVKAFTVTPTC